MEKNRRWIIAVVYGKNGDRKPQPVLCKVKDIKFMECKSWETYDECLKAMECGENSYVGSINS